MPALPKCMAIRRADRQRGNETKGGSSSAKKHVWEKGRELAEREILIHNFDSIRTCLAWRMDINFFATENYLA
jgi:hypothetical protein